MPVAAVIALLVHAAAGAGDVAANRPVLRVAAHVEGSFRFDRQMLSDILAGARRIWQPYADVTFEPAAEGGRVSGLELVITDRTSAVSDGASLGWIEFVDGRPANRITVSVTAASALMRASRWGGFPKIVQRTFLTRTLSRAIAHEIGHYLLGSRGHSAHGLMRGQLTADDIMQPLRSSDRLERADIERLHSGRLLARRQEALGDEGRETTP